ncbi:MAG TPA: NADH:ubiquinone reductase (Na(+)-transporting) subunit E, partial [Dysgonomonas sp.]|nr:NADH:ubiquinone reductase (Na(+)-transporting) subunit E [Dysgonomonas sp.]
MQEAVSIFVRSIFIENMIFAYFLGMCTFLAISKNVKTAIGLGVAVIFLLTITVPINYLLENYILKAGALQWLGESFKDVDLSMLTLLVFITVVASVTQILEMIIER